MSRRDWSWWAGLGVSLALHAGLVWGVVRASGRAGEAGRRPPSASPVYWSGMDRAEDRLGERDGMGYAINASPGERPMHAREADEDQAFTSKDPPGMGAVGSDPSWNTVIGEGGTGALDPALRTSGPVFGLRAPSAEPVPRTAVIGRRFPGMDQPLAPTETPAPDAARSVGAPVPAADPAVDAQSEVDPFAKIGSVSFRPGRVEARFGRKLKATRPRLSLAGQVDVMRMGSATVFLKVKTDAEGNVTNVDILKTSGSNEIDLACQHAVYGWWIEPPMDAEGRKMPEVRVWRISYRS